MQRQKTYNCGICKTIPDQLSHHKHHLETDKHQTKKALFKLQLEKLNEQELQEQYNTTDYEVILEGIENITSDYKITLKENKKLKNDIQLNNNNNKNNNTNTSNTNITLGQININISDIEEMQAQFTISNKDALRDKIHEIHNFLRNNGAGYGMNALKVFNVFYGLKKFELCNNEYIKKQIDKGIQPDKIINLYKKYEFNENYKFTTLLKMADSNENLADDRLKEFIIKNVLDGINDSKLRPFLMYEIPRVNIPARVYKYIIKEIDSITEIEKKCNVLLSGKIYEYFIGRDDTAISELGAFFTDRHIVNYIFEEKLKPKPDAHGNIDEMIDMFGGSGGFTTGYIDYLNKNYSSSINWETEIKKIHHYDMNDDVIKSAWLEMFCLTGEIPTENNVQYRNSFTNEFEDKKYKRIITNPPYGGDKTSETNTQIKQSKTKDYIKKLIPTLEDETAKAKLNIQLCEIEKEEKQYKQKLENAKVGLNIRGQIPRTSKRINKFAMEHNLKGTDKEAVSLIMLMDMIDIDGTVCGVLKEGVFFNKSYKDIRKCLIENFNVREVISVPQDQFENTSTKTSILIFDNLANKKTTSTVKFSEMQVEHYKEDKFIMQNGFVYLVENKDDISRVYDEEISSATREEILANPIYSLNGKDYNKKTIEPGEGFKLFNLSEIVSFKKGKQLSKKDFVNGNIPVIGGGINPTGFHNDFNMDENTILCSSSGNNAGYINRYDTKVWASDCFAIIPNENINKNYIYFILKILQNNIFKIQNGSAQPHIYSTDLEKHIKIPIPTTDESIKQWVDKISKPFDEKNTKEKKLKDLELEIQNRIKEITKNEDCDEVELGSICEINNKKIIRYDTSYGKEKGKYKFHTGATDGKYYCDEFNIDKYTIILNKTNGSGKCNIFLDKNISCAKQTYIIQSNNEIDTQFIYYYLSNKTKLLENGYIGACHKNLSSDFLIKFKIHIPKDTTLITALEPKFAEIEKLQNDIKQAETLYKQYIDELAKAAIKQSITPSTETIIEPTTSLKTIVQPVKTKTTISKNNKKDKTNSEVISSSKPKIAITKNKSPKAKTTFNDILETPE
jgi:type I restriction-modification system DNA methylase subunit